MLLQRTRITNRLVCSDALTKARAAAYGDSPVRIVRTPGAAEFFGQKDFRPRGADLSSREGPKGDLERSAAATEPAE